MRREMLVGTRLIAVWLIVFLGLSACSSVEERPGEFEGMSSDEIGCTVEYDDDDLYVVGPLGPSDSENIEPNDYTLIRLGRTASSLVVVAEFPDSGSTGEIALNEVPTNGVVVRKGSFRNADEPGYVVTCWRGDT